jgi:hypothetical protein
MAFVAIFPAGLNPRVKPAGSMIPDDRAHPALTHGIDTPLSESYLDSHRSAEGWASIARALAMPLKRNKQCEWEYGYDTARKRADGCLDGIGHRRGPVDLLFGMADIDHILRDQRSSSLADCRRNLLSSRDRSWCRSLVRRLVADGSIGTALLR